MHVGFSILVSTLVSVPILDLAKHAVAPSRVVLGDPLSSSVVLGRVELSVFWRWSKGFLNAAFSFTLCLLAACWLALPTNAAVPIPLESTAVKIRFYQIVI